MVVGRRQLSVAGEPRLVHNERPNEAADGIGRVEGNVR